MAQRVLVVDDDPDLLDLVTDILTSFRRSLNVTRAADGQAAIEAVKREPFDLVLLDIRMPVMDGIEALKQDVAMNPGDALMLTTLSRPDAVIMDVGSGDASDTRLFAKLQAIDDSLVVILLAGSQDEAQVRGWLKAGAFDWARKPVNLEVLESMVRRGVGVGQKHPRRGVIVPFSQERRRAGLPVHGAEKPGERCCPVCRLAVETADTNAVLDSGDIFHATCWLHGRAQAEQV